MTKKVPQNSLIKLVFNNVTSNVDNTPIDFNSLDDIIVAISRSRYQNSIKIIKYSENNSLFEIDGQDISVKINLQSDLNSGIGRFYTNLWLVNNGEYTTHQSKSFNISATVYHGEDS